MRTPPVFRGESKRRISRHGPFNTWFHVRSSTLYFAATARVPGLSLTLLLLGGSGVGVEDAFFSKLVEKRERRIFDKSADDGRKPVGGEAEETTQSWASRLRRGEAIMQAEAFSAGPRRVARQHALF